MKKQKKIINAEIEYTVPFTAAQVAATLARKAGCRQPETASVKIAADGSAVVVYTVTK